ncbi:c-type cytochrome [Sphingomonas quercus]|uniref:C-type cytochrome n=1 Tax=Sphingomonas quercus TaxID=2842451 RepID=A0ABS6BNB6_9SPHN|nr:c-type cytochrome [Sphingomonas quercus]MBU3079347.1 c-type cytochrome [Sphingomonas quercus]
MSSRFRTDAALAAVLLLALAGCHKPPQAEPAAPGGPGAPGVPVSGLIPAGGGPPSAPNPRALPYYDSNEAVAQGMRAYKQYNCGGCHFNGGGGIGPALMDDVWIYGGRLDQIYATIYQGRPNGMPAWGGKIPDQQIWQIAAYVRSMSLPETIAANQGGTPSQHPAPVPRAADEHGGWQLPEGTVEKVP